MLRVSDLALGYGVEPVVEGVSLEVPPGKFVSLVGPSGSGKTSILRAITGLLPPRAGRVELNGSLARISHNEIISSAASPENTFTSMIRGDQHYYHGSRTGNWTPIAAIWLCTN